MVVQRNTTQDIFRFGAAALLLLVVWQLATVSGWFPSFLLPAPVKVAATLVAEAAPFRHAWQYTVGNSFTGLILGVTLGIVFAVLLAASRVSRWLLEPYLTVFQSFPRESLLPIFVVWLGFGAALKITSSAALCFFPTAMIVLHALVDVRPDHLALMQGWGANRRQILLYLRLPNAIPAIVSAISLSVPLSLIGSVIGEFLGGNEGLGQIIVSSGSSYRVDRIFGAVLLLGATGLSAALVLSHFQRRYLKRFYQETQK